MLRSIARKTDRKYRVLCVVLLKDVVWFCRLSVDGGWEGEREGG